MAVEESAGDVELRGVRKQFGDVLAVDGVDLAVKRGEFLCLLGPSGCGKTTTLRLIAGFERPEEGQILIAGRDVTNLAAHKRDVNTVFQTYALFPHLSVLDNVGYGLKQRGLRKGAREQKARELLELVRLPQVEARKPRQLSGGQQQRVALARALANGPQVLLLDEPLGALDFKLRKEMQVFLKRLQHELRVTFIHVTHDQEEALALADRVAVMNAGRIEQLGSPREIYDAPATRFVADFIGETNFIRRDGAVVAVRPERLEVRRDGSSATPYALPGEVVTTMVVGPAVQSLVRTDDGQEVLVRKQRSGGDEGVDALREGDRVVLTWAEEAALVLDGEGKERA